MNAQKRRASILGSTLTSLTFESDSSSENSETEDDTTSESEDDLAEETNQNSDKDENTKEYSDVGKKDIAIRKATSLDNGTTKPKVRMKTLAIDGQVVYFCILCDKIFTKKKDKINHELAHENETLHSCPECGKEYLHESSLAHHIRTHDGEQLHFCDLCPKLFAQNHQLKAHMLSHSKVSEFSCKICKLECNSASELKIHRQHAVEDEMTVLWCDCCEIFCCRIHCPTRDLNKLHSFRCSACNELFSSLKLLTIHSKRYAHKSFDYNEKYNPNSVKSVEKEQLCIVEPDASVRSSRKRLLDYETEPELKRCRTSASVSEIEEGWRCPEVKLDVMPKPDVGTECSRKHYNRKPYCKKCNRSFKDASELVSHKLSAKCLSAGHVLCRVCGQEFSSQDLLDRHHHSHNGDQGNSPSCCKHCNKTFQSQVDFKDKLQLHKDKDLQGLNGCLKLEKAENDPDAPGNDCPEVFECHVCSKWFPCQQQLQTHLRLHSNSKSFQCCLCHKDFVSKHFLQRHLQVHDQEVKVSPDLGIINDSDESPSVSSKERLNGVKSKPVKCLVERKERNRSTMSRNSPKIKTQEFSDTDEILDVGKKQVKSEAICDNGSGSSLPIACGRKSSVLVKNSERYDAFQFSSDSSLGFKIAMARERRKLRKKKQLLKVSRSARGVGNKRKKKSFREKSNSSVTDQGRCEDNLVKHLSVEINAVKSEGDLETVVFVELTAITLVPDSPAVLSEEVGVDKENKAPPFQTHHDVEPSEATSHHDKGNLSPVINRPSNYLSGKVLVLDLEVSDCDAVNNNNNNNILSALYTEATKLSQSPETDASVNPQTPSETEHISEYNRSFLQSAATKYCDNSVCKESCSHLKPLEDPPNVENILKREVPDVQPLHSLCLMTANLRKSMEGNVENIVSKSKPLESTNLPKLLSPSPVDNQKFTMLKLTNDCKKKQTTMSTSQKTCCDIAASWNADRNKKVTKKPCAVNKLKLGSFMTDTNNTNSGTQSETSVIVKTEPAFFSPEVKREFSVDETESSTNKQEYPLSTSGGFLPPKNSVASSTCNVSCTSSSSHSHSANTFERPSIKVEPPSQMPSGSDDKTYFEIRKLSNSFTMAMTSRPREAISSDGCKSYSALPGANSVPQPTTTTTKSSSVFLLDTKDPALRDMNLMDMVSSFHTSPATSLSRLPTTPGLNCLAVASTMASDSNNVAPAKDLRNGSRYQSGASSVSSSGLRVNENLKTQLLYPALNMNENVHPEMGMFNGAAGVNQNIHSSVFTANTGWPTLSPFERGNPCQPVRMTFDSNSMLTNQIPVREGFGPIKCESSSHSVKPWQGDNTSIPPIQPGFNDSNMPRGPLSLVNSLPTHPFMLNPSMLPVPGEIFLGHGCPAGGPLQPSLPHPVAPVHPLMAPVHPADLCPVPPVVMPSVNMGLLPMQQTPHLNGNINPGFFYLPF